MNGSAEMAAAVDVVAQGEAENDEAAAQAAQVAEAAETEEEEEEAPQQPLHPPVVRRVQFSSVPARFLGKGKKRHRKVLRDNIAPSNRSLSTLSYAAASTPARLSQRTSQRPPFVVWHAAVASNI